MPAWLNSGLIFASYAVVIAGASLSLARTGVLAPGAAALLVAVLLLLAGQLHALAGGLRERTHTGRALARLRADLDGATARVHELEQALDAQTEARNEQLAAEVRLMETLVKGLAESMEAGLAGRAAPASPAPAGPHPARRADDRREPPPRGQTRLPLDGPLDSALTEGDLMDTIRASLEENRVDLYLQPIVTLPQRKTRFYEGLTRLRGRGGEIIMPDDYMRIAEPAGMMPVVDNLLLFRCVQVVRRLVARNRETGVFCNISAHSLLDSEFFPQFVEFMEHNKDLAGHLYFELPQHSVMALGPIERASLDALAAIGFRFSLDHVRRLDMDLGGLRDMGFRFVKVPAATLLGDLRGTGALVHAQDLKALFERNGLTLIAERVEDERAVVSILDLDIGYGQGFLFGEPRAVREEALSAPLAPGAVAAPRAIVA